VQSVDIWRASLDQPADDVAALHDLLDAAERSRAARFHAERDRRRFIVARATLRMLLGKYLDSSPEHVPLRTLPGGKPTLVRETGESGVHFNLSHCGEIALFAFADREVGIDVERISHNSDLARVAEHFFTHDEAVVCRRLVGAEQARFFYRTWVRKEAYLKATGEGLAIEPARVSISDPPGCSVRLSDVDGTHHVDRDYTVHDLAEIDGHVAAIAIGVPPAPPAIHYVELSTARCHIA